ncbi:MAG TPA: hypothetical protein VIV15_13440 [Anaerolineales bacterium]
MDYQQKMTRHLVAAEAKNAEVDKFEAWADAKVELAGDLDRFGRARESVKLERMKAVLDGEIMYRNRANVRDYHVRMATMYGIAALVERLGSRSNVPPEY